MIKSLLKLSIFISWCIAFFYLFNYPENYSINYISLILTNVFISTVLFFSYISLYYSKRFIFSITFFFVISFIIVNFQIPAYYLVNPNFSYDFFNFYYWSNLEISSYSLTLSSLCLLSFYVGFILSNENLKFSVNQFKTYKINKYKFKIVLYISLVFYILFLLNSGSYL